MLCVCMYLYFISFHLLIRASNSPLLPPSLTFLLKNGFHIDSSRGGLSHCHGRLWHRNSPRFSPSEVFSSHPVPHQHNPPLFPTDSAPLHLLGWDEEIREKEEEEGALCRGRGGAEWERRGVQKATPWTWKFVGLYAAVEGGRERRRRRNAGEPVGSVQRNSQGTAGAPIGILLLTLSFF